MTSNKHNDLKQTISGREKMWMLTVVSAMITLNCSKCFERLKIAYTKCELFTKLKPTAAGK
jgi:hypothetical protein